ncbi:MAG TPA: YheC/YheD family protein [Bacilli bacterium]
MARPTLGVMTVYYDSEKRIEEKNYFRKLIMLGNKIGLDVFVFAPEDVARTGQKISALHYDAKTNSWYRKPVDFPMAIYDRCRQIRSSRFHQLRQFRRDYPNMLYLNRPLSNKWNIHLILSRNEKIRPHLPESAIYQSAVDLQRMLEKHGIVYLKPINGTGGRGILRISKVAGNRYLVSGRTVSRRIFKPFLTNGNRLAAKLRPWNLPNRYLVQQGLDLKLENGRVHDYRMLIQKNGQGEWEVTGCAGRIGPAGSVTSNLHGGGKAVTMAHLLRLWGFRSDRAARIRQSAETLAFQVARHLEERFGQLCELALDLAIDHKGHVWLLEVNQKPSREVFNLAGEKETYRKAILRPLEYARWLIAKKQAEKMAQ